MSFSYTIRISTLDEAYLKIQTSWDGNVSAEPAKDESGAYLIYTADELMWFDSKAALSTSAKLMADIRINDSVDAAPGSAVYKWSPVGTGKQQGIYRYVRRQRTYDIRPLCE